MSLVRSSILVGLVLLLGGSAVPMRIRLRPEQPAKITELKAHVVVRQDEVIAPFNPPTSVWRPARSDRPDGHRHHQFASQGVPRKGWARSMP